MHITQRSDLVLPGLNCLCDKAAVAPDLTCRFTNTLRNFLFRAPPSFSCGFGALPPPNRKVNSTACQVRSYVFAKLECSERTEFALKLQVQPDSISTSKVNAMCRRCFPLKSTRNSKQHFFPLSVERCRPRCLLHPQHGCTAKHRRSDGSKLGSVLTKHLRSVSQ